MLVILSRNLYSIVELAQCLVSDVALMVDTLVTKTLNCGLLDPAEREGRQAPLMLE